MSAVPRATRLGKPTDSRRLDILMVLREARVVYCRDSDVVQEIDEHIYAIRHAPSAASDDEAVDARITQLRLNCEPLTMPQAIVVGLLVGATLAFNHEAA